MAGPSQTERFGDELRTDRVDSATNETLPYASVASPQNNEKPKGKGCGCWVMGCGGLLLAGIGAMVAIVLGGYWFLTGQVEKYTDAEAAEIPIVEVDEEAMTALKERIDLFSRQAAPHEEADDAPLDAIPADGKEDAPPLELVLTADEINALIQSNEFTRGRAYVTISGGSIQAEVSIPTDQIPGGKGRFFNADAELEVSMEDGVLNVQLVDAKVNGEALPGQILENIKGQNLAEQAYDDADTRKILRTFESIEVVDDAIHLRLKKPTDESAEPPSTPSVPKVESIKQAPTAEAVPAS